ncbi:MAG: hypothetical protein ABSC50_02570 [Candidatus Bathyarchaeia archaeon]
MTFEAYAETMLVAGITGSGLVLAVYTLAVGKAAEILSNRRQTWLGALEGLKQEVGKISADTTRERINALKSQLSYVATYQELPNYLTWGIGISFFGYMLVSIFSFAWLNGYSAAWIEASMGLWFLIATFAFLLTGLLIIKDVNAALKKQYQEQKRDADSREIQ